MKLCPENNGAVMFMLEGSRPCTILCFTYTVNQFSFTHFRYCVNIFRCKHMPQCKFSLYLKKAGLASQNIVHFLKKSFYVVTVSALVQTTVEYLNSNVSIGQLLQHISKSIVVCAQSRPEILTKTYNKEVYQASKPLFLLTIVIP